MVLICWWGRTNEPGSANLHLFVVPGFLKALRQEYCALLRCRSCLLVCYSSSHIHTLNQEQCAKIISCWWGEWRQNVGGSFPISNSLLGFPKPFIESAVPSMSVNEQSWSGGEAMKYLKFAPDLFFNTHCHHYQHYCPYVCMSVGTRNSQSLSQCSLYT